VSGGVEYGWISSLVAGALVVKCFVIVLTGANVPGCVHGKGLSCADGSLALTPTYVNKLLPIVLHGSVLYQYESDVFEFARLMIINPYVYCFLASSPAAVGFRSPSRDRDQLQEKQQPPITLHLCTSAR
jgi:hypothetical protein